MDLLNWIYERWWKFASRRCPDFLFVFGKFGLSIPLLIQCFVTLPKYMLSRKTYSFYKRKSYLQERVA